MIIIKLAHIIALTAEGIPHTDLTKTTLRTVLSFVFALTSAIALLIITIAGFRYTISRGDPGNIKNSKETIIYAVVGLVISISAYSIVNFVFKGIR